MTSRTVPLVAAILVAALSVPVVASGQTEEALIEEGLNLRRERRDAEALERFQRAHALGGSARALAQVALAEMALGRFVVAETQLTRAMQASADPWIVQSRPQLEQALASIQQRLATLELQGGPEGAEVFIDGVTRGTLPTAARLRVRAGTITIDVRATGFMPMQRQIIVSPGDIARESAHLAAATGSGVHASGTSGSGAQPSEASSASGVDAAPTQAVADGALRWEVDPRGRPQGVNPRIVQGLDVPLVVIGAVWLGLGLAAAGIGLAVADAEGDQDLAYFLPMPGIGAGAIPGLTLLLYALLGHTYDIEPTEEVSVSVLPGAAGADLGLSVRAIY